MNNQSPAVSIVIPCRNERRNIAACLTSILAQDEPTGGFEVVIADGMSRDGTREIIAAFAKQHRRIRMIDNPQCITPTALNAAIKAARGDIIIRMDAHSEYAADYIRQCVDTLTMTGAENVGGPPLVKTTSYVQRAIGAAFHSSFSTGGAGFHRPSFEGDVDTIHYGCWRRSTLLEVGLFDEELVRNQDDELNFRIKNRGGRLWQSPRIRSWYTPRKSLAALFSQYAQYGYWKVRVIQKHTRPASWRHLVPVLFVLCVFLGLIASCVYRPLSLPYAMAMGAYLSLAVLFSVRTAAKTSWKLLPVLPIVFFVYHMSYGLGFAAGLVSFSRYRSNQPASGESELLSHRKAA